MYYIDYDPGIGNALPFDAEDGVWDSKTEVAVKSIDTSELSVGPHLLGIRFLKSDGTWGYTSQRWFYVIGERILTGAEWFIDEDPGKGNGHAIALPADDVWDEPEEEIDVNDIDVSQLNINNPDNPEGHTIFVRFLDSDGCWGLTQQAVFHVAPELYIEEAEWTSNPISDPGAGHPMEAEDGHFDEPNEQIAASDTNLSPYDCIYVRVKDNLGRWSSRSGFVLSEEGEWVFDPDLAWNPENMWCKP